MSDEELQELIDEEVKDVKKKREMRNRDTQKYYAYLSYHGFLEKQLSHMKFEEVESVSKLTKERIKKKEFDRLKKKAPDKQDKVKNSVTNMMASATI